MSICSYYDMIDYFSTIVCCCYHVCTVSIYVYVVPLYDQRTPKVGGYRGGERICWG